MKPSRRWVAAAVLAASCAGALSSCGGSDSKDSAAPAASTSTTSTTSTTVPSAERAAWTARVNAICKASVTRLGALAEPVAAQDWVHVLEATLTELERTQADLRTVLPPVRDTDAVETYLGQNDAQIATLRDALPEVRKVAATGDADHTETAATPALLKFKSISEQQAPFAKEFGLRECNAGS